MSYIYIYTCIWNLNCDYHCTYKYSTTSSKGHFTKDHDDVIKWKHFPRKWPFVWGIHRSPVNSPYKGQWRGALMFSLICVWTNGWVSNRDACDLRRYRAHYDVTVMYLSHQSLKLAWKVSKISHNPLTRANGLTQQNIWRSYTNWIHWVIYPTLTSVVLFVIAVVAFVKLTQSPRCPVRN